MGGRKDRPVEMLTIERACEFDRKEIREYYRQYVNPALVGVMALIDFDKQFVRAKDYLLWDAEGNQYLDFLGGYGSLTWDIIRMKSWQRFERYRTVPTSRRLRSTRWPRAGP